MLGILWSYCSEKLEISAEYLLIPSKKKKKKEIQGKKTAIKKRSVDIKMQLWLFKSEFAGLKSSFAAKSRANTSLIHII